MRSLVLLIVNVLSEWIRFRADNRFHVETIFAFLLVACLDLYVNVDFHVDYLRSPSLHPTDIEKECCSLWAKSF